MPTRNANLLLDNAAQPANGINKVNVTEWYGGPLRIMASGAFNGANIEVLAVVRYPASGLGADIADDDVISLGTITEPGPFNLDNLNPCLLLTRVTNSASNTRVRVIVA